MREKQDENLVRRRGVEVADGATDTEKGDLGGTGRRTRVGGGVGSGGRQIGQGIGGAYPRGWARGQRGGGGERRADERLRLVGGGPKLRAGGKLGEIDAVNMGVELQGVGDPRWVLAVKAGELLEGTMMRPEKREQLILKGKRMGLNAFDSNLVVAIVQDQARRGYKPELCAGAGAEQLKMVPLPRVSSLTSGVKGVRGIYTGIMVVGIILVELLLMKMWLGK